MPNSSIGGGNQQDGLNHKFTVTKATNGTLTARGTAGADKYDFTEQLQPTSTNGQPVYNYVYGGDGNDNFRLSSKTADVAYGDAGNDYFDATDRSTNAVVKDTLLGGAGDDTMVGGSGNFFGQDGNDKITGFGSGSYVVGGEGNDEITTGGIKETSIYGGNGVDKIVVDGSQGGNLVTGDQGDDVITLSAFRYGGSVSGGAKADSVYGGLGDDKISISANERYQGPGANFTGTVLGQWGNDDITVKLADKMTLDGGDGNDKVTVADIANSIVRGGNGNDFIEAKNVTNTGFFGDAGNDSLNVTTADGFWISGGTGADNLNLVDIKNSTVAGGADDDVIYATNIANTGFYGDAGNDRISLTTASGAKVAGGDGDDVLSVTVLNNSTAGAQQADSIYGGKGNDYITTNHSGDLVMGEAGNDSIFSQNNSRVSIDGGIGNDQITLTNVKDATVSGGAGDDTVLVDSSGGAPSIGKIAVNLGDGNDNIRITDTFESATLEGGNGNDYIYAAETIVGNNGKWINTSVLLNGKIDGGAGDDSITADSAGQKIVLGGDGNDHIGFALRDDGTTDTIEAGNGNDTVILFPRDPNQDYIGGGNSIDKVYISLGDGNDRLSVDNWTNQLFNITVDGGAGDDYIIASGGNDSLDGGYGADTMVGGAGDDVFVVSVQANAIDTITDFQVAGTAEKIDLSAFTNLKNFTTDIRPLMSQVGADVKIALPNNQTLLLQNVQLSTIKADDFVGVTGSDGVVTGTAGDDVIDANYVDKADGDKLTANGDKIDAGAGNDAIKVYGENDTIDGGDGNDKITASNVANSLVFGGNGNDQVEADGIYNTGFFGEGGDDYLLVNTGYSLSISGGMGADRISLGDIRDSTVAGGTDNDTIDVKETTNTGFYGDAGDDLISLTEAGGVKVTGGDGDDTVTVDNRSIDGPQQSNSIYGGNGNDNITTGHSGDLVMGEAGNDTIFSKHNSRVSIDGGIGNDQITLTNVTDATVSGGAGDDTVGSDYSGGKKDISTGDGNDLVNFTLNTNFYNGSDDDIINTGAGNDTVNIDYGSGVGGSGVGNTPAKLSVQLGDGNDVFKQTATNLANPTVVDGGAGNDYVVASGSNDVLFGGMGDDTLSAGKGENLLTGGAGADIFVHSAKDSAGWTTMSDFINDFITDFKIGEDKIAFMQNADGSHITMADLTITNSVENDVEGTLIDMRVSPGAAAGSYIFLAGVHAEDLAPTDFLF